MLWIPPTIALRDSVYPAVSPWILGSSSCLTHKQHMQKESLSQLLSPTILDLDLLASSVATSQTLESHQYLTQNYNLFDSGFPKCLPNSQISPGRQSLRITHMCPYVPVRYAHTLQSRFVPVNVLGLYLPMLGHIQHLGFLQVIT